MVQQILQQVVIVLAVAFIPPILLAALVHGAKRYRPEPGYALRRAFLWGALGAALISLVVNTTVQGGVVRPYLRHDTLIQLATAVIVAPLVEETAKVFGMRFVRREADEPVDGLIYGATIGLGFSATENLFYELSAFASGGLEAYVWTAIARTFSSSLLHATASAMAGYGIAKAWSKRRSWILGIHWWFAAVLIHSIFNLVATYSGLFGLLGTIPLIAFAVWSFGRVRTAVTQMSLVAPTTYWRRIGPAKRDPESGARSWRRVDQPPDTGPFSRSHAPDESPQGRGAASDQERDAAHGGLPAGAYGTPFDDEAPAGPGWTPADDEASDPDDRPEMMTWYETNDPAPATQEDRDPERWNSLREHDVREDPQGDDEHADAEAEAERPQVRGSRKPGARRAAPDDDDARERWYPRGP